MPSETPFDLKFTSREVTAWGGLALLKRMLDGMGFKEAVQSWDLPPLRSNRGYRPEQLIEHRKLAHCRAQVDEHLGVHRVHCLGAVQGQQQPQACGRIAGWLEPNVFVSHEGLHSFRPGRPNPPSWLRSSHRRSPAHGR